MFLTHYSALRVSVWKGDASMGTGSPEPIGMMVHVAASPAEIPVPSGGLFWLMTNLDRTKQVLRFWLKRTDLRATWIRKPVPRPGFLR